MPPRTQALVTGILTAAVALAVALWPITIDTTQCGAPLRAITYPPSPCQTTASWHLLVAVGIAAIGAVTAVVIASRKPHGE